MSDIFIQSNFVFCSFKKNTGNVVSTTTVLSFIFRRGFQQLAFRIHYFELIEKIVVIPGCARYKTNMKIFIFGNFIAVMRNTHSDNVCVDILCKI